MAKLSPATRIIIVVGIIFAIYLAYQDLSPAPPTPTHHSIVTSQTASSDGILPEDLNAHYARYSGGKRDPFVPGVFPPNSGGQGDLSGVGKHGGWTLTGINQVNGVTSALVENDSTGDSVFLEPGDRWNGLKVLSIGDQEVTLENTFGQQTQLSFPPPPAESSNTAANPNAQNSAIPSLSQVTPLPPLAAAFANAYAGGGYGGGYGGGGGGRRRGGRRGGGGFGGRGN